MSFQEISLDQFKVFELEENAKCIVDDVQNVYAAQVFDAFAVKVSFISQEISKIEHTQSQHQAKVDNQESWRPFSLAPTKLVSACYEKSTIGASPSVWKSSLENHMKSSFTVNVDSTKKRQTS